MFTMFDKRCLQIGQYSWHTMRKWSNCSFFRAGLPEVNTTLECDRELNILQNALSAACQKHEIVQYKNQCGSYAANTLQHASRYLWHKYLVSADIGAKVPVFWAGFSDEFDKSGMATKRNLTDFVNSVNGILLHGGGRAPQTEWGEVAEALGFLKMLEVLLLDHSVTQ